MSDNATDAIISLIKEHPYEWLGGNYWVWNQCRGIAVWRANKAYGLKVRQFDPKETFVGVDQGQEWEPLWWNRHRLWWAVKRHKNVVEDRILEAARRDIIAEKANDSEIKRLRAELEAAKADIAMFVQADTEHAG